MKLSKTKTKPHRLYNAGVNVNHIRQSVVREVTRFHITRVISSTLSSTHRLTYSRLAVRCIVRPFVVHQARMFSNYVRWLFVMWTWLFVMWTCLFDMLLLYMRFFIFCCLMVFSKKWGNESGLPRFWVFCTKTGKRVRITVHLG